MVRGNEGAKVLAFIGVRVCLSLQREGTGLHLRISFRLRNADYPQVSMFDPEGALPAFF